MMRDITSSKNNQKRRLSLSSMFGIFIILVTFIACFATLLYPSAKTDYLLDGRVSNLTEHWTDGSGNALTLPMKLTYRGSERFTLETTLPAAYPCDSPVLLFKGKYLNAKVYLNQEFAGEYESRPAGSSKTLGMQFLFLSLPAHSEGMPLRIEGEMLLRDKLNYELFAPVLGEKGQILFNIIMSELPTLFVIFCVMATAALLLLFSIQARSTRDGSAYFYTSLFSLIFALYSLFSTQTIYFFTRCPSLIYAGEFIMLSLLSLPILILLYYRTIRFFKKLLVCNILLVTMNFIGIILLHYFTPYEFRTTLIFTHCIIVISLVDTICAIVFGSSSRKERRKILLTFSPIFAGTIGNLVLFYLPIVSDKTLIFLFFVLIFVILQTSELIHSYLNACRENIQTSLYQKMAYTDALTGVGNRTAFEEKIKSLTASVNPLSSVYCIVADINDLKQVNDNMGHDKGDELICQTAKLLQSALFAHASLYRTGGDEFVIFAENCSGEAVVNALSLLNKSIDQINITADPAISIAIGYDCYEAKNNDSIAEVLKRADAAMYKNKRLAKGAGE